MRIITWFLLMANTLMAAPCNFSVSVYKTDVDCYRNQTGSATVYITGPAGQYSYTWSTGDTTATAQNLKASTYFVKVNDDKGCEVLDFVQIDQPDGLLIEPSVEHVKCYGDNTGSVKLVTSGGVPGYIYAWSNGSETALAENLYAGDYIVEITDQNFCILTDTFTINEPDRITDTHVIRNATGYKLQNGTINMNISGGSKPYSYKWFNMGVLRDTIEDLNKLPAGTYNFELTDANNCVYEKSFEVLQPDTLQASFVVQDVDCSNGVSGAINMTVKGGVQPYSYEWANNEIVFETGEEDVNQLTKGSYYVTITDANGNVYEDSVYVDEPTPILVNFDVLNVSCNGGNDGKVFVTVSGGLQPYSFQWSNGHTGQDLLNAQAGGYQVDIVDQNGCSLTGNIEINEPGPYLLDLDITQITCKDASDGAVSIKVEGNTAPYLVSWNTGDNTFDVDELSQGRYYITVYDANKCDTTVTINLINPDYVCIYIPNAFTPNNDGFNDTWIIENTYLYPDLKIFVYSKTGFIVYEGDINTEPWNGKYNGKDVAPGTYYYTLNLNNGDKPFKGTVTIVR